MSSNIFRKSRSDYEKHPTRYYSKRLEDAVARELGGKRTLNSGALMFLPGDVTTDKWTIECKTCEKSKKSFSMQKEWFQKMREESILSGKPYEALVFNFGPEEKNYAVVELSLFNIMQQALSQVEELQDECLL